MQEQIKIIHSPDTPSMGVAGDILIKLHVPYSEKDVTVQINPSLEDYKEDADTENIQVRQVTTTKVSEDTKTIKLGLEENNVANFSFGEKEYQITLLSIGKEFFDGQEFPAFEFSVTSSS